MVMAKPDASISATRRQARDYLRLLRQGHRDVAKRLAAERSKTEKREVPRQTVRTWIHKARNAGLLPQTSLGRLPNLETPKR